MSMVGRRGTERVLSQWCCGDGELPCSYTATTQSVGKEKGSFKASKGWFRSFKNVMSLSSMKTVDSVSADHVAAGKYIVCLKEN